jgi:hypothetical protein
MSHIRLCLLAGLLSLLAACSSVDVKDYAGQQPTLDLHQFFNGKVQAWGQFQDRSGKVVKRFTVDMTGTWQGDTGTLSEHFSYDDGSKSERTWILTDLGHGRYSGTAADIMGTATGEAAGPVLHWRYALALPVNGRTINVRMNDWMFLQDDHTLINRTEMSKFGFHLGDITLFFRK